MKHCGPLFVVVIILLGVGCSPPPPAKKSVVIQDSGDAPVARTNVGDIEAYVSVEGLLSEDLSHLNVIEKEARNPLKKLIRNEILCWEPYPEIMPVNFKVIAKKKFYDVVVVLRIKIIADGKELAKFATVLGGTREQDINEMTVNLFDSYDPTVDQLSAYAEIEAILLPKDTDVDSIDMNTVTSDRANTTTILGTLVTVYFKGEA